MIISILATFKLFMYFLSQLRYGNDSGRIHRTGYPRSRNLRRAFPDELPPLADTIRPLRSPALLPVHIHTASRRAREHIRRFLRAKARDSANREDDLGAGPGSRREVGRERLDTPAAESDERRS